MDFNMLPNFLIIGAAKSGTTSLFNILANHPDIYASEEKEIRFFSHDDRYRNGVDWYQHTYFPKADNFPIRMEATPAYLTWSDKVAFRILAIYGAQRVKFAAIFRDPVKRAYSHYWHRVRSGDEDPDLTTFTEAIHTEDQRLKENWKRIEFEGNGLFGYFRAGCYAQRLEPYLKIFPREDFFFLLQEDLAEDFHSSMVRLQQFLGIPEFAGLNPLVSNESSAPRSIGVYSLFKSLKRSKNKKIIKTLVPKRFRRWLREEVLVKPFSYPPIDTEIEKELYTRYSEENKRLEIIIGRDLSHWQYPSDREIINS